MQIAVIGAGNMGCVYGGNLARVGEAVTLIDPWEEHIKVIRVKGLEMDGLHGRFTAPVEAFTDPASAPKADLALIMVNTYDTQNAADSARKLLKDTGFALTLQNGLGNIEILSQTLGKDRVMAGLSFHSGDLKAPGAVTHTNQGPTYLGEFNKTKTKRLKQLNELMMKADMEPVLEPDIMATIWGKFVHNCAINAVCAITELRPGHIQEVPELDHFQSHVIREVLALISAKGIRIPDPEPMRTIKAYCSKKFHRVSMKQHLARGRMTEIDALNGYVVRESEKLSLSAPYNDALTKLIKGLEHQPVNKIAIGS